VLYLFWGSIASVALVDPFEGVDVLDKLFDVIFLVFSKGGGVAIIEQ
jgi:hypothetical protein